jgi:hypothetical protein
MGVTCVVGTKGIVKGDLGVLGGVCDITPLLGRVSRELPNAT